MPVHYQYLFYDDSGTKIGQLAGADNATWTSAAFDHIENGVGRATLFVRGDLSFTDELTDRTIMKVRRKVVRGQKVVDWYTEWEGMLDYIEDFTRSDVNNIRMEFGGYVDLLRARYIKYNPTTVYAFKSGAGETVIKEFVNENAGPGAISPPRYCDGVTPGLTIEADGGQGNPWIGNHGDAPLLDTITKIANATGMFFDIVSTGGATFEFRCYYLQRGYNRAAIGVDKTTGGLNAYGNAAVTFSLEKQNMENPSQKTNFRDGLNSITYIGMGSDNDTLFACRQNAADIAYSDWSRRESVIRSQAEYDEDALLYAANEAVIANRVKTTLDFDVVQVDSCLYGEDYWWGDVVTALYKDTEYTKRISSVGIQVSGNREVIRPVLLDV